LLFDRENSSLAVSSLLNSPYAFQDVFSLEENGALQSIASGDITQDIQFDTHLDSEGRIIIDVNNEALSSYIGRIYYNISALSDINFSIHEDT